MSSLGGQPGELKFTVEIKRAATGKVDKFELTGRIDDGGNTLDGGKECGDGRGDGSDRGKR